jgi:nucleoside-diphosphate-sugar epimerase
MYGPYQPSGSIVPDLFEKSNLSGIIEVENSSSTRDFVYVGDVAKAVERCLDVDVSGVINVGSGKETSVLAIAIQLSKFSGKKVVLKKGPDEKIKRSVLDIDRARDLLCWEPEMPLEKGLKVTWRHLIAQAGACN